MTPCAFSLWPESASHASGAVDHLYEFLLLVAVVFTVVVCGLVFVFAVRYRRRASTEVPAPTPSRPWLEVVFFLAPLPLALVVFGWGASLYVRNARAPRGADVVEVVAKQWMWKIRHSNGHGEINELHLPVGRPVRLRMISQDVIHSFYVPAFRKKQDVLPGRYTSLWFQPTRTGRFHLFCAEYCGTNHSQMRGWVTVMEPAAYQAWLGGAPEGGGPAEAGRKLFEKLACATCHGAQATQPGPRLGGLFGRETQLRDGSAVRVDAGYVRESILDPRAKVVAGFEPIMPSFRDQVSEEDILDLLAYIRSLAPGESPPERAFPGDGRAPEKR